MRPHFITPQLDRVRAQLRAGQYAAADMQMAALLPESLEPLIEALARERGAAALADRWAQAAPHSRHAEVLAAHVHIWEAWVLRGEGYVRDIPPLRRKKFAEVMLRGQQRLLKIIENDPGNALALAGLIHCSIVIGAGEESRLRWLNQAMDASPFHCPALIRFAQGTLERWGGEDNERYSFANWIVENAPAGSCAHVVVADTLFDDAFMASGEVEDIRLLARCTGNAEDAEWLRRALLKWLDATPDTLRQRVHDVMPAYDESFHSLCLERFALAAYFAGAREEARLLLTALRGRLQAGEWENFIAPTPLWWYPFASRTRGMRRVHDAVCRDLGLDPRAICA